MNNTLSKAIIDIIVNFNPFQTWIDVNGEQIEIPYNAGDYKLALNFSISY